MIGEPDLNPPDYYDPPDPEFDGEEIQMSDIKKHGGIGKFIEINSVDVSCHSCDTCFDINLYHSFDPQGRDTKTVKVYCPGCKSDLTEHAFEDHNDKINEDNIERLRDWHDGP